MRDDAVESDRSADQPTRETTGPVSQTNDESTGPNWKLYVWDLLSSVAIVVLIGALLFTASGIWPPMVAVESGSMEPVMEKGDLVFIMEADRFPGPDANPETGVVTARAARDDGYTKFEGYGDVIVFHPNGNKQRTPVIHRAMFWVEKNENWLDKANPRYLPDDATCKGEGGTDVPNCPAPHAGFITKGDNNGNYDQLVGIAREGPIKPAWVVGTAEFSVPYLGNIRLNAAAQTPTNATVGARNATAG